MDLEEAKLLLKVCERRELRDHSFGDKEVGWWRDEVEVAFGYFGGKGHSEVGFRNGQSFLGDEAKELSELGKLVEVVRNDETGPEAFEVGVIAPGLSLEDVREELEHRNVFKEAAKDN